MKIRSCCAPDNIERINGIVTAFQEFFEEWPQAFWNNSMEIGKMKFIHNDNYTMIRRLA
jgi:hypothetical protein